ncbi:hypothetical protein Pflav_037460 [Phytohabitans flavus]|uniref:Uncharacterized protein n=1 Tax=Phytohabitans flavus TaxID=1076124 RepID=A0A6F8XU32_9ACTN|nr:hypothetical protein Pflav_037460 [Phytohabitans flavus]
MYGRQRTGLPECGGGATGTPARPTPLIRPLPANPTGAVASGSSGSSAVESNGAAPTAESAAEARAAPVAYRSAGSFSSARSTTARTAGGTSAGSSGGGVSRCIIATATGLSPMKGGWPAIAW